MGPFFFFGGGGNFFFDFHPIFVVQTWYLEWRWYRAKPNSYPVGWSIGRLGGHLEPIKFWFSPSFWADFGYERVSLQITTPSFLRREASGNFLVRKSLIKNFPPDNPPLFSKKNGTRGGRGYLEWYSPISTKMLQKVKLWNFVSIIYCPKIF